MLNYFNPDISKLKEVSKVESESLLGIKSEQDDTAVPDNLMATQLINMILIARQSRSTVPSVAA